MQVCTTYYNTVDWFKYVTEYIQNIFLNKFNGHFIRYTLVVQGLILPSEMH